VLPQCAAKTALFTFLQDTLLNTLEVGNPVPTSIVLWTKGREMVDVFSTLALALAPLPVPVLVKNLEDFDCLPAKHLTDLHPEETPTTVPKALAFARWMADQHLA